MPTVRPARAADLRHLAAVEDGALPMFEQLLGPTGWGPSTSGGARADQPGFLLVTGEPGAPTGFAHTLHLDGAAHLEQLSVAPTAMRQGLGSALVRATMAEARWQGYDAVSLCTFRDVPWNAPFYAGLGFVEVVDLEPYQRRLREQEMAGGLDRLGARVVMSARVGRAS